MPKLGKGASRKKALRQKKENLKRQNKGRKMRRLMSRKVT